MMLPKIPYESGAERIPVQIFGGLDRRAGAGNGAISDMENMSGDDFPVMATREKRAIFLDDISDIGGIFADDEYGIFYVSGSDLYNYDGITHFLDPLPYGTRTDRRFVLMGSWIIIFPDKFAYDMEGMVHSSGTLNRSAYASCTFTDGTYAGEPAEANTILAPSGFRWVDYFKVGDGVKISQQWGTENNKTAIIREIFGNELRFDENTFVKNSTAQNVSVTRDVPYMDFIFVHDNRLWGCEGDTIYCSKLGDPFNWNVFDGLSTDSWTVNTGTPGSFTGAISFMGYPMFFKEDRIFKVYGNRPQNFEVISSVSTGVSADNPESLAVVGDTLYYFSPSGFVRYNGMNPVKIDDALNTKYIKATAGSDGRKYYVRACINDGVYDTWENIVYTPDTGMWHKEDSLNIKGYARGGDVLYAESDDKILVASIHNQWRLRGTDIVIEPDFDSYVTFADFDMQTFAGKYPVRLWLRYESENDLTVEISYNGGAFETVTVLDSGGKNTKYSPLPIRRCDRFRIKISTTGAWKLYAMEFEVRAERKNRKGG